MKGETVGHVCNSCLYAFGIRPKNPPDSGSASLLCMICRHYGIGSNMKMKPNGWGMYEVVK